MHAPRSHHRLSRAAACISLLTTAAAVHAQPLELYVDDDAPAGGDGLSWTSAMNSLDAALEVVRAHFEVGPTGDRIVRVAQGVYIPGDGLAGRDATFTVLSSAFLEGGYAGIGAANPDERDPGRFITVLSGDRGGDDLPNFANRSDNVYHVVTFATGGSSGQVTGFTIRGGHADGEGSRGFGGGVTTAGNVGTAHIVHCEIRDNYAIRGGGIGTDRGFLVAHSSLVIENAALVSGGGAWFSSYAQLGHSRFIGNTVTGEDGSGGAVAAEGFPLFSTLCQFNGNSAHGLGGAIALHNAGATIGNSTFASNSAQAGTAIAIDASSLVAIVNSILAFNGESPNSQVTSPTSGVVNMGHCLVHGQVDSRLLASGSSFSFSYISAQPRFVSLQGLDGIAGTLDDDLRLLPNSLAIDAGLAAEPWYHESGLPWAMDLAGAPRFHDDPAMPDIGAGWRTDVDIGAYESQGASCRADHDGDGHVSVPDIFSYLSDWFAQRPEADFDRDRAVEVSDLFHYLAAWFAGC